MSVFVTVGSTSFDDLIKAVCSDEILQLLAKDGFKSITFQIGSGTYTPEKSSIIEIDWFRYKDSLSADINAASLVIGHGGAGTILESLTALKPLVVVLNEELMDNHQTELAEQLGKDRHLVYSPLSKLRGNLERYLDSKDLVPYVVQPEMFSAYLEDFMGFR